MTRSAAITLNGRPDGFGFVYGTAALPDGSTSRLNVMPPRAHWKGDTVLPGFEPHATHWLFFIDGEEVCRATSIEAAGELIGPRLALEVKP